MQSPVAAPPFSATAPARAVGLALAACALAAGCRGPGGAMLAAWDDTTLPPARVNDERQPPRTIPVEVLFVRHDPRDPAFGTDLWRHVDEQAFGADLRRRLEANGLRTGVVTGTLPADVGSRLAPAAGEDPAEPGSTGLRRTLRLLPGRRAEVIAAAGLPELVLLERGADGVGGGTYRDATTLVSLQAWPDADGRVRVRIVPEIRHGDVRRSWVGEEGMFRLETGQTRHPFDDLGVEARLPPGGLLLVGVADGDGAAVGDALLRDRDAAGGARLLVIRPLAPATDPLFVTAEAGSEDDDR